MHSTVKEKLGASVNAFVEFSIATFSISTTATKTHTHTHTKLSTEKHKNFKCTNRSDNRLLKFRTSAQAKPTAEHNFRVCHSPKLGSMRCSIRCCRRLMGNASPVQCRPLHNVCCGWRIGGSTGHAIAVVAKGAPLNWSLLAASVSTMGLYTFSAPSMPDYRSSKSHRLHHPLLWATFCDLFLIEILECVQNCMESVCLVGAATHQPQPQLQPAYATEVL